MLKAVKVPQANVGQQLFRATMLCGVSYRVLQGLCVWLASCVRICSLLQEPFVLVVCLPPFRWQYYVYDAVSISLGTFPKPIN